jgi:hypothetical protein
MPLVCREYIMRLLFIFFVWLAISATPSAQATEIPYSVAEKEWDESLGNQRALVEVLESSDAVHLDFLWRRHDATPEKRQMLVVHADSGERVSNIFRVKVDQERCELVIGPVSKPGLYYFYYLPYTPETIKAQTGEYLPVEGAPAIPWVARHRLKEGPSGFSDVASAKVKAIQARNLFHSFYPMEVIATQKEVKEYAATHQEEYLIFPEDRTLPIRMLDALPLRWIQRKPYENFTGTAMRNEFYAFQLGIFALQKNLQNLRLGFSDLVDKDGNRILKERFTCFNTEGVDIDGRPFSINVDVKPGEVRPLWIGVDIAADTKPGTYEGEVLVTPGNLAGRGIKIALTVESDFLADRGDKEPWRHSRLRWLNSTLGIDEAAVAPYTPLVVDRQKISCLGRSVQLNSLGLPAEIFAWGNNILSSSLRFTLQMDTRAVEWTPSSFRFTKQAGGIVGWESVAENGDMTLTVHGEMEADGRLAFDCQVTAKTELYFQDIRLEMPLKQEFATYLVGMGRMGGFTPKNHLSRWMKTEDSFWIGDPAGGLHCELRGDTYNGPLRTLYQPNPSRMGWFERTNPWVNGRSGGFRIDTEEGVVTASAFSGPRSLPSGKSVNYQFALLITPVKKLDTRAQFSNRYFHAPEPTPEVIAHGGNVMNIHHANRYNPFINYPFIAQKELRDHIDQWHARGWKVKIYYTVRELSNHMTELWAMRSLGYEILADGEGGGYQWLREHLVSNYTKQWYTHLGDGEVDAAILSSGESRFYNYYIEGLDWLLKNMDIDGVYLDDVSYDRRILKRMRKVMEKNKPGGCMIDLHSNTQFSNGPANQYLEYFPYIDKTIFGEGFHWNLMPADYWLTETSGIPYGIMNDIFFQDQVNNRRGMTFGMTVRLGKSWVLWELWDRFGIAEAEMHGYWEKNPVITTDQKNVVATAYIKEGKTLIALGSWNAKPVSARMNIDWKRLGLNPLEVTLIAPEIEFYQKGRGFLVDEPIPVDALGDRILILSQK